MVSKEGKRVPTYTPDFFKFLANSGESSADVVVSLVIDLVKPRSVVDVGCGVGAWLAAFNRQGVDDVVGMDGDWVPHEQLQIPDSRFIRLDLSEPFRLQRSFDLAVSLEVAEHLPAAAADSFVGSLTALAPVVLFSAAIPFQGGNGHVNEQWPSYWAGHFAKYNFTAVNCLRPRLWTAEGVAFYYAQNLLLFVRRDRLEHDERLRREWDRFKEAPLDVAHPITYGRLTLEEVGPRRLTPLLWRAIKRAALKRIRT